MRFPRLRAAAAGRAGAAAFLLRGGEIDTERMARILLDEFRGGVLGRITLEMPAQQRGEAALPRYRRRQA